MPAVVYQHVRWNEMCPRIAEDNSGGRFKWLFHDNPGKIRMSRGDFQSQVGAQIPANGNNCIGGNMTGSREIRKGRFCIFAPTSFAGMCEVALPIPAIIKRENT